MKAKRRRYLLLLLISVAVRTFFYLFPFEGTPFEPIAKTHILYDLIFYGVMLSLLEVLKDRKWLMGLVFISFIDSIAYSVLAWIQIAYSPFTRHQYIRADMIMGIVMMSFYLCIFFARKSPARIFFRCMTAIAIFPYIYIFSARIFHFPSPGRWLLGPAGIASFSILINILLALAVLRTPELRKPQYADFLE